MARLTCKEQLYHSVAAIRNHFAIREGPVDIVSFLSFYRRYNIEKYAFSESSLCAVSFTGDKCDSIVLNDHRNPREQNFDCGHELYHLLFHRKQNICFQSFDSPKTIQDPFLEWQANEGSAELLVPYREFVPLAAKLDHCMHTYSDYKNFVTDASNYYFVPEAVIELRLDNLKYEISQYSEGKQLSVIRLLSRNQQNSAGINITSLKEKARKLSAIDDFSNISNQIEIH